MDPVAIDDLDPAAVLAVLFNAARPQGNGFLEYSPVPLTIEAARALLARRTSFDYLQGRVLKVSLAGPTFDPASYDRDNGAGAAAAAVAALRAEGPVSAPVAALHRRGIAAAADELLAHVDERHPLGHIAARARRLARAGGADDGADGGASR